MSIWDDKALIDLIIKQLDNTFTQDLIRQYMQPIESVLSGEDDDGRHRIPAKKVYGSATGQSCGASAHSFPPNYSNYITVTAADNGPEYGTIYDAGIRAGEITGRRCWWCIENRLFSVYMTEHEWFPNEPMKGDVSKSYGVHAYKRFEDLAAYGVDVIYWNQKAREFNFGCARLITGTVAMWGSIVEHERGYRAEYAKIMSLDTADHKLRLKYGV